VGDIVHNIGSSTSSIRPANKPVITVDDDTTFETGSTFIAPVADVRNWNGKNISYTVDDSAVNMSVDGTYVITYTAVDTLGRTTVENRNIIVNTLLKEIDVANYGNFVEDPGTQIDWVHYLMGSGHANGKETYTLDGSNPDGYMIIWYSNPEGVNFNGKLDTTNPTWVLVKYNTQNTDTVADFSGGSSDLSNGSIAIPSSDIVITYQ
jgi:hypothetical protein